VPGYAAPQDTIGPASRTTLALVGIVAEAARDGSLADVAPFGADVPHALRPELALIRERAGADLSDDVIVALLAAWTQLFGLVSFELFGQTRNVIHHHAALFDATVLAMARSVGLASSKDRR
jgi:hypothetical protein